VKDLTDRYHSSSPWLPDHLIIDPLVNSTKRFHPESSGQPECRGAAILRLQLNLRVVITKERDDQKQFFHLS
jgi:hypothetical protein